MISGRTATRRSVPRRPKPPRWCLATATPPTATPAPMPSRLRCARVTCSPRAQCWSYATTCPPTRAAPAPTSTRATNWRRPRWWRSPAPCGIRTPAPYWPGRCRCMTPAATAPTSACLWVRMSPPARCLSTPGCSSWPPMTAQRSASTRMEMGTPTIPPRSAPEAPTSSAAQPAG